MTATSPVELYGEGLLLAAGDPRPASPASWLRYADGRVAALDIPTWSGPPAGADEALLARCTGPVLDLRCGPGRLTRALVRRGVECLGVDVAPSRSRSPAPGDPPSSTPRSTTPSWTARSGPRSCSPTATSGSAGTRSRCSPGPER